MSLMLGDIAPNFTADTTHGRIRFHDWLGSRWGILFSHPGDFTPVCTTEIGALARAKPEFDRRNIKIIGLSVDDVETHHRWIRDIEQTANTRVSFPLIADPDRIVAGLYWMLYGVLGEDENDNRTVRSLYVIGPDKTIRLILTYPNSTGRSVAEILRAVDSLQLADHSGVLTPADWKRGNDCLLPPNVSADDAVKRFPLGVCEVKPYLRYTPQPKASPVAMKASP